MKRNRRALFFKAPKQVAKVKYTKVYFLCFIAALMPHEVSGAIPIPISVTAYQYLHSLPAVVIKPSRWFL